METETTTNNAGQEARLRERAERAEAELMRHAREAEMLRVNRDQLKAKLTEAEALIRDLQDAEDADRKRMYQTEAMVIRVRKLCDDMEAHCGGAGIDVPHWVTSVRKALDGS